MFRKLSFGRHLFLFLFAASSSTFFLLVSFFTKAIDRFLLRRCDADLDRSSTRPHEGQAQNEADSLGNGNGDAGTRSRCDRVGVGMKTFEFLLRFGGDDVHPHERLARQVRATTVFAGVVEANLELKTKC